MNLRVAPAICVAIILIACAQETPVDEPVAIELDKALSESIIRSSPNGKMFHYVLADEYDLAHLPNQDPANPITRSKVELGKMIFFDPGLGQDALDESCYETYSCATCHVPEAGFLPGRIQGIADGAQGFGFQGSVRNKLDYYEEIELDAQGIRPLSVLNVAYMTNTLWSGLFGAKDVNEGTEDAWVGPLASVNHHGYTGLESQNIEGVELHRMSVNEHVLEDYGYKTLFDKAFPEISEEERYTDETISFALGAYLRTLLTTRAPFQQWLKGDHTAMTDAQKRGALHFFGKANCTNCHNGPSFSSMTFHALGTKDLHEAGGLNTGPEDARNLGRGMFTGRSEDAYKFKVPQLYNLKDYSTFFHGSSKTSLEDVVEFKLKARSENSNVSDDHLSPAFSPVDLTPEETSELVDFLRHALYDAEIDRYVPQEVPSGHCFPNNDVLSKEDLGCE